MFPPNVRVVPELDLDVPEMPPRSRLFGLPPIGLGTPRVEGLISYLVRLARAHSVSPRRLIRTEFMPRYPQGEGGIRSSGFFGDYAKTINGVGAYARHFSALTTSLTREKNLDGLTILPWQGVIPEIGPGLVASHPRWCRQCLIEQRKRGLPSYFPLAWSFHHYRLCPEHGTVLDAHCPGCSKAQPAIPLYPDQGYCTHCGIWLGTEPGPVHHSEQLRGEWIALARSIEDMVENNLDAPTFATHERLQNVLGGLVKDFAQGDKEALSRQMGFSATTLTCWTAKGKKPSFPQFLRLCSHLGLRPSEVLNGQQPKFAEDTHSITMVNPFIATKLDATRRKSLRLELKQIADNPDDSRPMTSIAESFGMRKTYLNYWFPDLCRIISSRYWKEMRDRTREKWAKEVEDVKRITQEIHQKGEWPSRKRVESGIRPLKLSLRRPHLIEAYKATLRDISLQTRNR